MQTVEIVISERENYKLEIKRNESIRITGVRFGRTFDKTFNMGDFAEYDSYNLSYLGAIVGITDKSVSILPRYESKRKTRLKLYEFCWRNWDFDLEEINRKNNETSHYI